VGAEIGAAILNAFPRLLDLPPAKQSYAIGGSQAAASALTTRKGRQ
jgi:hypothetical protein